MIINNLNPTLRLKDIVPEEIYQNSSNFIEFLKAYYEWLHTTTFDISDINGTFTLGEYVIGQTSNCKGKILQIKNGQLIVLIESTLPFKRGELILGQTSGATADLNSINDNVLRTSANLINYRDLELSVDKFADYLKYELYSSIPSEVAGNKILLAKKVRDIYQSKSQEQAYKFLFKSLYNQDVEIIYPGEEILRVSDGKFVQSKILRAQVNSNIFDFLFKTIKGSVSNALANVVDIKLIAIGSTQVAEMTLSLVSGSFIEGETIFDINEPETTTILYGIISDFIINDSGTGYQENDILNINGDGLAASVVVGSIFQSPIDAIKINSTGYGYRLNTYATVNNTGTGGSGLIVKVTGIQDTYTITSGANNYTVGKISDVKVVNKGNNYRDIPTITLEDTTIKNLGLLTDGLFTIVNAGNNYTVNDWLSFSSSYGSGANAIIASVTEANTTLLLEDNSTILLETSYYLKNENATFVGSINRIEMTNFGSGYLQTNLPTITINTSTGSSANIICTGIQGTGANVEVDVANNTGGIGSIRTISINNFGVNYTNATVDATVSGNGDANVTAIISGLATSTGQLINDDGKIDFKKIQDSYYYQDFSYVVRSGIEISYYKDIVKKIIHPSGLEFFGEIGIVSELDLTMKTITEISPVVIRSLLIELISLLDSKISTVPLRTLYWAYVPINYVSNNTISTYSTIRFSDTYNEVESKSYDSVSIYKKITGTVSSFGNNTIIGSGTLFSKELKVGNFIIIGENQLLINTISSNTVMTVVVDNTPNYTNYSAYATGKLVQGSMPSVIENNKDTMISSGGTRGYGPLAAIETGSDTFVSIGSAAVDGPLAATEVGSDTFAATGKVVVQGSVDIIELYSDTFFSDGNVV